MKSLCDSIFYNQLRLIFDRKKYTLFKTGNYNLNLIAIRKSAFNIDEYDDILLCIYYDDNETLQIKKYNVTTDAGMHWLLNPMNRKGTAIVKPGQYRQAFKLGRHRNKYDALIQNKPLDIWRDNNHDEKLDMNDFTTESGMFGINIHRSTRDGISKKVGKWSAGCIVFSSSTEFTEFMSICKKSAKIYGDKFTFTLLNEGLFYQINC